MNSDEFKKYLDESVLELEQKRLLLEQQYGVGHHDRYVLEYDNSSLMFFDKEQPTVEATILPVATYITETECLVWFWSLKNLPEPIRKLSSAVKKLYDITGQDIFRRQSFGCSESTAWDLASMACKCLDAQGVYRVPQGNMYAYVLISQITYYNQACIS